MIFIVLQVIERSLNVSYYMLKLNFQILLPELSEVIDKHNIAIDVEIGVPESSLIYKGPGEKICHQFYPWNIGKSNQLFFSSPFEYYCKGTNK